MRPVASSIASLSDLLALRAVEQGANRAYCGGRNYKDSHPEIDANLHRADRRVRAKH